MRAVLGVSQARGASKACNSGAAAEPEHWQPFDGRRQFEPVEQHGIEAWDRKPGDRIGHDHVDRIETDTGRFGRFHGHLFQEIECVPMKRLGTLLPAMWP